MVSDETYELCLPVLQDASLEEEDKIDKLETLLKAATALQGQALEHAVLDAMWRFREGGGSATSPPPIRQTILRRPSPASWRGPASGVSTGYHSSSHTPLSGSPRLGVSPLAPPGYVPPSVAALSAASAASASFATPPPLFSRVNRSAAASPFGSPRPSPRLAFATPAIPPVIPHSPSLNAYEFASDSTPAAEISGDAQQTDNVDWLVSDDAVSVTSSLGGGGALVGGGTPGSTPRTPGTHTPTSGGSGLNAAAPEFSLSSPSSQHAEMTPYDMLRSILGPTRSDEEIDAALDMHGYDLGATIAAMMESEPPQSQQQPPPPRASSPDDSIFFPAGAATTAASIASSVDESSGGGIPLAGKAYTPDFRPSTPATDQKSGVLCKFFLSTGQCLRADCRFSHDLNNHLCKYWVTGNCLAGNTCVFSHDPAHLMSRLVMDGANTPPLQHVYPLPAINDPNAFPVLQQPQPTTPEQLPFFQSAGGNYTTTGRTPPPPGFKLPGFLGSSGGGGGLDAALRPRSRPSSRHQMHVNRNRENAQIAPSIDDTEAFPSLGQAKAAAGLGAGAGGKKHHGKRGGHGHHKEGGGPGSGTTTPSSGTFVPSSLADIVKMSPSPGPGSGKQALRNGSPVLNMRNGATLGGSGGGGGGENSAAARAIPAPKHIPWLETGDRVNKAYLKARQEAIKHGGLRNKFLQSAAQAWNRNDARAAKALSLRGQSENDLMRKAHREAARELYARANSTAGGGGGGGGGGEIYVDLHGLHADEAVEYLEEALLEHAREARPVYAITGTGHHSKNGKDKVGKAVRQFLQEWRYAYREFSVPSDRNSMGGILGIDARSWDKSLAREGKGAARGGSGGGGGGGAAAAAAAAAAATADILSQGVEIGEGKVKLLVRDGAAVKEAARGR